MTIQPSRLDLHAAQIAAVAAAYGNADAPMPVSYTHLDVYKRQVSGRVADLKTLDTTLATLAREQGAGSDQRPNAWAGYGIFALSLVAGALAWTGVGRRVAEYR